MADLREPRRRPRDASRRAAGLRVYADGVFDLFHSGHLEFLRKARAVGGAGAVLVVGVLSDRAAGWKRAPVVPHAQRLEMLRGCALVDEVVGDAPRVLSAAFLGRHRLSLVVHGDDDRQAAFFAVPRALGIMVYVPYTRAGPLATTTSEIIARIRARSDLAPADGARGGPRGGPGAGPRGRPEAAPPQEEKIGAV
jgi:cytidyltransferase-like protein